MVVWLYNYGVVNTLYRGDTAYCLVGCFILSHSVCVVVAPYVKVYLMDGKTCVEKQKTMTARRTLDPLYQQQLCFTMPYNGKILQVRPSVRPSVCHSFFFLSLSPSTISASCG